MDKGLIRLNEGYAQCYLDMLNAVTQASDKKELTRPEVLLEVLSIMAEKRDKFYQNNKYDN